MMNIKKYIYGVVMGALSLSFASCYNADRTFPDYEGGTTAYFAYQFPVRTLVLGNDTYDNTLDNAHKCRIWATMGGAYGGRDAYLDIEVADSLCDNLFFTDEGGNAAQRVLPMPANYYSLASNVIPYNGDSRGYVEVQFTDDFFNDPASIKNTYVIPLLMKSITGIDHILTGTPREGYTPARVNTEDWNVLAKDYVLYCVKYINPWDASYIRRGIDKVKDAGRDTTFVRKDTTLIGTDKKHYTENPVNADDEICTISTKNMTQAIFPVSFKNFGVSVSCNLILTFDGNKCTISCDDANVTATGTGEYITKGTEQAAYKDFIWGNENGEVVHRDILRLDYKVDFAAKNIQVETSDTLVVRDRQSNIKTFYSPLFVK